MLRLGRKERVHFMTLIEICAHLIEDISGHICWEVASYCVPTKEDAF